MVVTRKRGKDSLTTDDKNVESKIPNENSTKLVSIKRNSRISDTQSNAQALGKKNESKINSSRNQKKRERVEKVAEIQHRRKHRTTNQQKIEENVEETSNPEEDKMDTSNKTIADNEKIEDNNEQYEVLLSEYSSEDEGEQNKKPKTKINVQASENSSSKETYQKLSNPKCSKVDCSLEETETKLNRKSRRSITKVKYVESESESEKSVSKNSPSTEINNLSESESEALVSESESDVSESESDNSSSSAAPAIKRKRMPPRSTLKSRMLAVKTSSEKIAFKKDTRKRVDLSEMEAPEGKDSVIEKMKRRQFDGIVRYFLGGEGACNVPVNPDLLQRKLEKNRYKDNSLPSTSTVSKIDEAEQNNQNVSQSVKDTPQKPGNSMKRQDKKNNNVDSSLTSIKEKNHDENDSDSESEWEEVSDVEQPMDIENYNPEIPKEGIEINISVPDPRRERRKKRQVEFANYARLFLNRFKKDTQVAMHKVHLLGYIAHMLYVNGILLNSMCQGLALSILPNDFLGITTKKTNQILLNKMVTWFRNTFTLEQSESSLCLKDSLVESLQTKVVTSSENYCLLFVIIGRAMRLDVRFCKVAFPISFKADNLIPTQRQKKKTLDPKAGSDGNDQTVNESSETKSDGKRNKSKKIKTDKSEPLEKPKSGRKRERKLDEASTSKEVKTKKQNRSSKKNITYKEAVTDEEDSGNDEDFEPEKHFSVKKSPSSNLKKNRKVLSSDSEDESCRNNSGPCIDSWAEVFLNSEGKWVCVEVIENIVNRPYEIEANATRKLSYVLAVDNDSKIKDVTQRYASGWLTGVRKLRVDSEWLEESLLPYEPPQVKRERDENQQLNDMLLNQPMPTTIGEFKNHPLYVLKRHLLKYEGLYPPDIPPLGFIRKEPVYARECVRTLHSRESWKREGRAIRLGEEPYKLVKARPRWDKVKKQIYTPEEPMDVYGEWQTEPWISPPCNDGKVPRNEYGNVELFKPSMLPAGAVHLRLPGLNRIARKLGIDCAPAMVGFDGSASVGIIPVFDGFVACKEHENILVEAWDEEQLNIAAREREKYEKRVYGNWRKLIRGLLIREKIKSRYFRDEDIDTKCETTKKKK